MSIKEFLKTIRVNQWIKNFIIIIPIFFTENLLNTEYYPHLFFAILSFALVSSGMYLVNDWFDAKRDSLFKLKEERSRAFMNLSNIGRIGLIFLLIALAYITAFYGVGSEYYLVILSIYAVTMFFYSWFLKHIGIVDTLIVAFGFVLRVLGGAIIFQLEISSFLVMTIISAALLISFGKRQLEISRLGSEKSILHRPALSVYPKNVLDIIIGSFVAVTFLSYMLFAYFYTTKGFQSVAHDFLPPRFKSPQWLLITIPFAIYVLVRYLVVIYSDFKEDLNSIWLKDKGLRWGIILWLLLLFLLIYFDQVYKIVKI